MVDLLSMFRRRPAKQGRPGFARLRGDITAPDDRALGDGPLGDGSLRDTSFGDSFGSPLTSPVRDTPPVARDQPMPAPDQLRAEPQPRRPHPARPAAQPAKPNTRTNAKPNGSAGPQLLRRPGLLAVHSVEKSFGSRQVVRGVSIYVRRGEA